MAQLPRVLTADESQQLGFSARQVRTELGRDRWRRLGPGVYLTRPDEPTRADWSQVGLRLASDSAALSGWDALRTCDLGPTEPVHPRPLVLVRSGRDRTVGGVQIRVTNRPYRARTPVGPHGQLASERVVVPARALADAALLCDRFSVVRAMVTSAVQRRAVTAEQLDAELQTGPRNGSAFLRRALADVLAGAGSVAEAEARDFLLAVGVSGFVLNAPVHAGGRTYVVDFYWPALRAVVEIDSREFHFSEEDWKRTLTRHNALTAAGVAVTHYPPSEVRQRRTEWALEVAAWLDTRARSLLSTPAAVPAAR